MTWLPIYNAFCVFLFLVSAILWSLSGLIWFLPLFGFSTLFLWLETTVVDFHFMDGYWLFILGEFIVFVSLLTSCLWFYDLESEQLSKTFDMPLFGCFLLLSSSVCMTAYHHDVGTAEGLNSNLIVSVLFGLGFVALQLFEFAECDLNMLASTYYASCFCTVGLHFMHVVIGLVLLLGCLFMGTLELGLYYSTAMVWYWHFVDYIWLLVYLVVYVC